MLQDSRLVGPKNLLGGAFFLTLVEAAWQGQGWLGPRLPKRAQRASEGIARAVRVLRIACWASAFVLTTSAARQACFAAADKVAGLGTVIQGWAHVKTQPLLPPPHSDTGHATPDDGSPQAGLPSSPGPSGDQNQGRGLQE
ncbi:hypothetical protein WJX84_005923 [Apatococcus fuscideae]|uniref:Uncharacterized protein n=1 Tax=Apatococcus fuscideae TaxID=2026836 RepID=A0AAW1S164_9CHLO